MLVTSILFFSHNVFYPIKDRNHHLATFDLSSANAFNFDHTRNLSFGKELREVEKMLVTAICSFPTIFSNVIFSWISKTRDCMVKG